MNTKVLVGFAVCLFLIFALANSAFADFDAIKMVGFDESTTLKDSFGWNEQPWLYLDLPQSDLTYSVSWWSPEGSSIFYDNLKITSGTDKVWHTLDNWFASDGPRQLGYWDVRADYSWSGGGGTGSTNFTVTPEPVGSVLFLVGGISLAAARLKRRKKR